MYHFQTLNPATFQAFAETHASGNYLQTIEMRDLLTQRDWQTYLVGLVDEAQQVVAAAVLSQRPVRFGQYFQIDGGFLADYHNQPLVNAFTQGLREFTKQRGGLFLRIAPNEVFQQYDDNGQLLNEDHHVFDALKAAGFQAEQFKTGWTTDASPNWQYRKDLRPFLSADEPIKALQASYAKDVNYYLKKNKQFGIQIREIQADELPEFKALTQHTADRLNYHDKDLDFYEKTLASFGERAHFVFAEMDFTDYIAGQTRKRDELAVKVADLDAKIQAKPNHKKLPRQRAEFADQMAQHDKRILEAQTLQAQAKKDRVVIAGALFLETPNELIYLYSGTYEQYKHFYGPYQVQDTMLQYAVAHNIPWYNFYGISGVFDGSDGVLKFKQMFSGVAQAKVGTFILPIAPFKYRLYTTLRRLLGR